MSLPKTMKQNENEQNYKKNSPRRSWGARNQMKSQLKRSRSPTSIQIRSGWPGCRDEVIHEIPLRRVGSPGIHAATAGSRRCLNKSERGGRGRDDTTP